MGGRRVQAPADTLPTSLEIRDDARLARRHVDRAARAGQPVPLARQPHQRERLVAAQQGEVEDEVMALVAHRGSHRLVNDRQLGVAKLGAEVDDAGPLAQPADHRLDDRRGVEGSERCARSWSLRVPPRVSAPDHFIGLRSRCELPHGADRHGSGGRCRPRHVSGSFERFLIERGERVVRVTTKLMADSRRRVRAREVRQHRRDRGRAGDAARRAGCPASRAAGGPGARSAGARRSPRAAGPPACRTQQHAAMASARHRPELRLTGSSLFTATRPARRPAAHACRADDAGAHRP